MKCKTLIQLASRRCSWLLQNIDLAGNAPHSKFSLVRSSPHVMLSTTKTNKKSRVLRRNSTLNGLKLDERALPFVIECCVLEFLPDCLVNLTDTSRTMKTLVDDYHQLRFARVVRHS